ncbi:MAG TPA: hypothetical protein VF526_05685 [Solirubrobacteraceae bacterium]
MQLRTVGSLDAVLRPDAASVGKRAVVLGVRIPGLDDERRHAGRAGERLDDVVARRDAEGAAGKEVVLDVDGEEGGLGHGIVLVLWCGRS